MEDRYIEKICTCGRTFSDYKNGKAVTCSRKCDERAVRERQKQAIRTEYERKIKQLEARLDNRNRTINELRGIIDEQSVEVVAAQKEARRWREMVEAGGGTIITHFKHQVDIRQEVIEKYIKFFNEHKHEWEKELG